jgi:Helix-turn-helix of DDE superfamily endonuclease
LPKAVKKLPKMILQSTYVRIKSKRELKSYAGVDLSTYKILHSCLEKQELEKQAILANRPTRKRAYGAGSPQHLASIDDKLLFILHYYKSYPTMDVMATKYEMSRSSVWNYVHALSGQLHQLLVDLGHMPLREMPSIEDFKAFLEANKVHQLIIDVTERTIERPQDKVANRAQFSGKKKDIRLKIPL